MAENHSNPSKPASRAFRFPIPLTWGALVIILANKYAWGRNWLLSSTPILCFVLLSRNSVADHPPSFLLVWAVLATINLGYTLAATSWPLYILFLSILWPATIMALLVQFPFMANQARKAFRRALSQLHFINDKIAFFDLPALEIDTEVAGLMVVRGVTFSLLTLTLEAHGVEVGIKLTDDMELAIQTELVKVSLFRHIEVSDVFANLKGGIHEMTFGQLQESTQDADGDPLMDTDTQLLRAATAKSDEFMVAEKVKMTEYMTDGKQMLDSTPERAKDSLTKLSPSDQNAIDKFNSIMDNIKSTNAISMLRKRVQRSSKPTGSMTDKGRRAAICSLLHDGASISHPPHHSIKVTTLRKLSRPSVRRTLHRLPLLLRLLLNPLSYFHPVRFSSITAAASGAWIKHMLSSSIFKEYADNSADLRAIRDRITSWLADANFTVQLDDITGLAQVPIVTDYNISCLLKIKDIMINRTIPKQIDLHEVARFGGADAAFQIPSYLLPHHEHLLPAIPNAKAKQEIKNEIADADGKPQKLKAKRDLEQAEKDESNITTSIHVQLPVCFDQTLLDFIAALVKATKLIEMEKDASSPLDTEIHGFKDFAKSLNSATKNSIKKAAVGGIVNDRWIAKLVGKVTKALETAHGDIGYSGGIPVALKPYRDVGIGEASKILP